MAGENTKTFFSYARVDSEFVLRLVKDLRAAGADVWLDQFDIGPGKDWDTEVEKALRLCPRRLIVLSPASVNSQNVLNEVSYAREKKTEVIPVLYQDCEIPLQLCRLQWVDFRTDYESGFRELTQALAIREAALVAIPMPNSQAAASEAEAFYKRGKDLYEESQYDQAIDALTQAIRLKPDYAEAYSERGNDYHEKGDYDRAIQDFNQALKLNPNYPDAYNDRGNAYLYKGDYDRAIQDFNQALKLNPKHVEACYNRANAYHNRGNSYHNEEDYNRAIHDYTDVLKFNPNFSWAYNNRGVSYEHKKQYEQALQDFDRALQADPNNGRAKENRERVAAKLKEHGL